VGGDGIPGRGCTHGCSHGDGVERGTDSRHQQELPAGAVLSSPAGDHPQGHKE